MSNIKTVKPATRFFLTATKGTEFLVAFRPTKNLAVTKAFFEHFGFNIKVVFAAKEITNEEANTLKTEHTNKFLAKAFTKVNVEKLKKQIQLKRLLAFKSADASKVQKPIAIVVPTTKKAVKKVAKQIKAIVNA